MYHVPIPLFIHIFDITYFSGYEEKKCALVISLKYGTIFNKNA